MVSFLEAPFKLLQNFVSWVGEIWQLLLESFKHLRRRRWLFALTLDQIATNGINSLPIVLLTVSAAGAVLALYTAHELASRGGERFVGWLVAYTVFREVCPVATGLVIAARVGSAYAAEIGTMKVTEQIDALRVMGVSPVAFLVLPRLLACVVITPTLCLLGDVAGVLGGYLVAVNAGVRRAFTCRPSNTSWISAICFGAWSKRFLSGCWSLLSVAIAG